MAEYNRFVSYVYAYENNKKTLNNGFSRVETRDNTCSVYVHMKELYGDSHTKYRVYMVKRTERGLTGIYLGNASRVQNQGEFNCRITKDNINDSGISLIEIAGIIILGDNGRKYGTCWDDEPLDMELFAEQGTGGHENSLQSSAVPKSMAPSSETPDSTASKSMVSSSAAPNNTESKSMVQSSAVSNSAALNSTAPNDTEEQKKAEDSGSTSGTISEAVAGRARFVIGRWDDESQGEADTLKRSGSEDPEIIPAGSGKENEKENPEDKKENPDAEPYKELMAESIALAMPPDGEAASFFSEPLMSGGFAEGDKNEDQNERKRQSIAKRLGRVLESGIKMYPFEDNEIDSCIRLEIQDIGMLPMKFWVYAGNSFVLHSYYSYRHLILARKKDGSYILGVPGMGEKKDSFMAQMFGFNTFKAIREKSDDLSSSDFGYWYVKLL